MSSFFGLDIARKALTTSQKGIEVTAHNIANANTPGFSRQRLSLAAVEPAGMGSRFAYSSQGMSGGGVRIITVDQIRNPFLDRQFRHEQSMAKEYATRAADLQYIESLFDELSGTGLSAGINDFLSSLQEVSKSPTSVEYRTNMIQNAIKLTETFHHYTRQLTDKQAELDRSVKVMTGQINDMAQSIRDLNVQIARYELSGQKANDLRDQRNLILDKLSQQTDFAVRETSEGYMQVLIGNEMLVNHADVRLLEVIRTIDNPITNENASLYQVVWADNSEAVGLGRGEMKALLDLRDGNTAHHVGIPHINEQINRLAAALVKEMNEIHRQGWSLPGANGESQSNVDFFTVPMDVNGEALPVNAANIRINQAIIEDVNLLAMALEPVETDAQAGDNRNSLRMIARFSSYDVPDIGNFGGFLESFVATLAVETSHAEKRMDAQNVLVESINQQRLSISGVSLDEEMTRMIQLQHSYAAASRVITAIDQNLDVLINRTGVVGR